MNKKIKAIVITLLLTLGLSNAYAGAGHSHVASQQKVETNAKKALIKYVKDGKLVKSWSNGKKVESKRIGSEWKIVFLNSQIEDEKKQKLVFYMTSYGKLKGANYNK